MFPKVDPDTVKTEEASGSEENGAPRTSGSVLLIARAMVVVGVVGREAIEVASNPMPMMAKEVL